VSYIFALLDYFLFVESIWLLLLLLLFVCKMEISEILFCLMLTSNAENLFILHVFWRIMSPVWIGAHSLESQYCLMTC